MCYNIGIMKAFSTIWFWWRHAGFRRYFFNTGWMFAGQIFSLGTSFLIGIWMARYLGPFAYGNLNYAIAFTSLFGIFASLGLDNILSRELVNNPQDRDRLLGTVFRLKLWGSLAVIVTAAICAYLLESDNLVRLLIVIYSLVFVFNAANVVYLYFQAQVLSKKNAQVQITVAALSALLKIGLIIGGGNLVSLMLVYVFDAMFSAVAWLIIYRRQGCSLRAWRYSSALAKSLWHDAWPLMLSGAAMFIYLRIDQVMIGSLLDHGAVGLYSVSVRFVEVWYFIPGMICASLLPAIINAKKTDINQYRRRLRFLYALMLILAFVIAIPSAWLAPWFLPLLFGSAYAGAVPILQIYIFSSLGFFLGWAINQYLLAENMVMVIFQANLSAMIINVALNFYLIPRFGLLGAAVATLLAYSLYPLLSWLYARPKLVTN